MTTGGELGMAAAVLRGMRARIEMLTRRGLSPGRMARHLRRQTPMTRWGLWFVPRGYSKGRGFRRSVTMSIAEAEAAERDAETGGTQ